MNCSLNIFRSPSTRGQTSALCNLQVHETYEIMRGSMHSCMLPRPSLLFRMFDW